jgi:hypothetical protein
MSGWYFIDASSLLRKRKNNAAYHTDANMTEDVVSHLYLYDGIDIIPSLCDELDTISSDRLSKIISALSICIQFTVMYAFVCIYALFWRYLTLSRSSREWVMLHPPLSAPQQEGYYLDPPILEVEDKSIRGTWNTPYLYECLIMWRYYKMVFWLPTRDRCWTVPSSTNPPWLTPKQKSMSSTAVVAARTPVLSVQRSLNVHQVGGVTTTTPPPKSPCWDSSVSYIQACSMPSPVLVGDKSILLIRPTLVPVSTWLLRFSGFSLGESHDVW